MAFLYLLAILILLNIIYGIGLLGAQVLRKSSQHYFLGFNPGFVTFSLRGVKFTLGVYVPMIGLARIYCIDNFGKKQLFYPWKFSQTSVFQRLLLTYSGVLALFIFGVMLSILSVYTSKDKYIPKDEVIKHGIYPSRQARTVGFLPGDKVIAMNGRDYKDFLELVRPETIQSGQTYTIVREGQELVISLTDSAVENLPLRELFLTINAPFSVGKVLPESPAEKTGILSGDKILKVNGHTITSFQEMNSYFELDDDGEVILEIQRGATDQKFERTVVLNEYNKIGISIDQQIEYKTGMHSLLESFQLGVARFWSNVFVQFKILGRTLGYFVGKENKTLSGPNTTSAVFSSFSFSWFASFTFLYVVWVILLNFLPLPKSAMLEVIPLGYEAVKRKPFPYKSFRIIRQISIGLLVLLIMWQLVNDIVKLF